MITPGTNVELSNKTENREEDDVNTDQEEQDYGKP